MNVLCTFNLRPVSAVYVRVVKIVALYKIKYILFPLISVGPQISTTI